MAITVTAWEDTEVMVPIIMSFVTLGFVGLFVKLMTPREFLRLLKAPPVPPQEPRYWWSKILIRYAGYLRRWVATVAVAMLAAVVAVDLSSRPAGDFDQWVRSNVTWVWLAALFLVLGLVTEIFFAIWRVTKRDPSNFTHRPALGECLLAGYFTVFLILGWILVAIGSPLV